MRRSLSRAGSATPHSGEAALPRREKSRACDWRHAIGNQAAQRADGDAPGGRLIARHDTAEERHAHGVGEAARRTPPGPASLIAGRSAGSDWTLSDSGQRYFEPLVGAPLHDVRLHVDARADHLARLAGAEALNVGRQVFIPARRFSPESPEGRGLLGHELAHAAQRRAGPLQIQRQPKTEPHYPTEEEQREIEKILSREFETQPPAAPVEGRPEEAAKPAEKRGKALNDAERAALAVQLQTPYFDALTKLESGAPSNPASQADAFKAVKEAREAVVKRFGKYSDRQIELTVDPTKTPEYRRAFDQVLVTSGSTQQAAHALAITVVETECAPCHEQLAELDEESKKAVVALLVAAAFREREEQVKRVAELRVGGFYSHQEERIHMSLASKARLFGNAVHELIHAMTHPAFRAAFRDERAVSEGFTEYFAQQVVSEGTSYQEEQAKVGAVRTAMSGPFIPAPFGGQAEESLRLAYFQGRLDLIGWRPSGPKEQEDVAKAGGAASWDPAIAREKARLYRQQALAAQAPSRNVLDIGLYFTRESAHDTAFSVRYARVLWRDQPYAEKQVVLEGELWGSPFRDPASLGASIGVAGEYQQPYFYIQGGVRFVGTTSSEDGTRIDLSPFLGAGVRAWQTIRVGPEAFVLQPLTGQERSWGGGVKVGVEF